MTVVRQAGPQGSAGPARRGQWPRPRPVRHIPTPAELRAHREVDVDRSVLLVGGIALTVLLVLDGQPMWRYGRGLVAVALTAVAIWQADRLGKRARGVVALALGAGGTAVGGAIAGVHLSKSGVTLTSAMAAVFALAGVALLVLGARWLLADRSRVEQVAVGFAVVVAFAIIHWVTVPAVMVTNMPPIDPRTETPADHGLAFEDVTFDAVDGVELAAWYVPGTTGANVILMHGASSTRSTVLDEAAVLAAHGYGTLLVDARGHGDSEGRAMEFGWYGTRDIDAALTYLLERRDVDPSRIGVMGMSMGGEGAIGAAGADERIRAVVAEGATARVAADKAWLSEQYGMGGWITEQLEKVQYAIADLLTNAPQPAPLRSAVASSDASFLLITAGTMVDEGHAAAYLESASADRVTTWTVAGAGHTDGLETEPDEWGQRVIAFLDAALSPATGT